MKTEGKIKYLGFSFHDGYPAFEEIINYNAAVFDVDKRTAVFKIKLNVLLNYSLGLDIFI